MEGVLNRSKAVVLVQFLLNGFGVGVFMSYFVFFCCLFIII